MSDRWRSTAGAALAAFLVATLALAGGCSDNSKSGEIAQTPTVATASPAPTPTPTPPPDIRTLDLAHQADVAALAQRLSGVVAPEEIIYADLTADGLDDAVVPISSGGTQGDLGFIVLGYRDGALKALLTEAPAEGQVRVEVLDGQLVESQPLLSEGDKPGFPSRIKISYYVWRYGAFVVDRIDTKDNPNLPREP
jgi:hypothetical protein